MTCMTTLEQILEAALGLPAEERERLVTALLESLDEEAGQASHGPEPSSEALGGPGACRPRMDALLPSRRRPSAPWTAQLLDECCEVGSSVGIDGADQPMNFIGLEDASFQHGADVMQILWSITVELCRYQHIDRKDLQIQVGARDVYRHGIFNRRERRLVGRKEEIDANGWISMLT
jgi:hypothetical protein